MKGTPIRFRPKHAKDSVVQGTVKKGKVLSQGKPEPTAVIKIGGKVVGHMVNKLEKTEFMSFQKQMKEHVEAIYGIGKTTTMAMGAGQSNDFGWSGSLQFKISEEDSKKFREQWESKMQNAMWAGVPPEMLGAKFSHDPKDTADAMMQQVENAIDLRKSTIKYEDILKATSPQPDVHKYRCPRCHKACPTPEGGIPNCSYCNRAFMPIDNLLIKEEAPEQRQSLASRMLEKDIKLWKSIPPIEHDMYGQPIPQAYSEPTPSKPNPGSAAWSSNDTPVHKDSDTCPACGFVSLKARPICHNCGTNKAKGRAKLAEGLKAEPIVGFDAAYKESPKYADCPRCGQPSRTANESCEKCRVHKQNYLDSIKPKTKRVFTEVEEKDIYNVMKYGLDRRSAIRIIDVPKGDLRIIALNVELERKMFKDAGVDTRAASNMAYSKADPDKKLKTYLLDNTDNG